MTYSKLKGFTLPSVSFLGLIFCGHAMAYEFKAGDTTADIYGYVKLDLIYDFDNDLGDTVDRAAPRLDGVDGPDGFFRMHARESRVGFSTSTPVGGSSLKTTVEGDFFSDGDAFRLRHAFAEWNNIIIGQTWTNFASFVSTVPIISFTGPTGRTAVERQTQLRYTDGNFSVALEDPAAEGGTVTSDGAKSQLPDVTLRYTDTSGDFQYSVSGVVRYLEYDTDGLVIPSASDTAIGWGVGLAVAMNVTDTLTLRAGLTGGDGIGGYIHGTPKSDPAFEAANGDLETIKSIGGVFGASLRVGPGAVNVSYSKTSVDLDDNPAFSTDNDTYEGAWVNYIWSPNMKSPISYGVEANWNKRETVDGKEGTASRLQAMIMVEF